MASSTSNQGRGAKANKKQAFMEKKNFQTQAKIMAGCLSRLGVDDPVTPCITKTPTQEPTFVPISFGHVPSFVKDVWRDMRSAGGRAFQMYDTDENLRRFIVYILYLCEAKLVCAQRNVRPAPAELPERGLRSLEQLEYTAQIFAELPKPLAILLAQIGITIVDKQVVCPVLAKITEKHTELKRYSSMISYAPSGLTSALQFGAITGLTRQQFSNVGQCFRDLDAELLWSTTEAEPNHYRLPQDIVDRWVMEIPEFFPSEAFRSEYSAYLNAVKQRPGYIIDNDILNGDGTQAQLVCAHDNVFTFDEPLQLFSQHELSLQAFAYGTAFGLGITSSLCQPNRFYGLGRRLSHSRVDLLVGTMRQALTSNPVR